MKRIKSKGLGDTVAKITKATGIKKAVKFIAGEDCGCDQRQERLNKLFPYKTECLQESEYKYLKTFFASLKDRITSEQQKEILKINNRVFHQKRKPTSCTPCIKEVINGLRKLYDNYLQV